MDTTRTHVTMIGPSAHVLNSTLSVVNTVGRTYVFLWRERESCTLGFQWHFRLKSDSKIQENDNICVLQLPTGWDNPQSDPMAKILCGVGHAHSWATYCTFPTLLSRADRISHFPVMGVCEKVKHVWKLELEQARQTWWILFGLTQIVDVLVVC